MKTYPSNYIQFNTKFRSNPADNSNDCRIDLADKLQKGVYRLVYFLFPNTISSVNNNNNKISVQLKDANEIITCIIDTGFYTHDSLPNAIMKALNGSDKLNEGFIFDYSDVTRHITISNLFSEFRIVFDDKLSTCSELLGYSEVNTNYSNGHISQGLINLEPIHMLNVSIDGINSIDQKNLFGTTFVIPIPSEQFGYTNYVPEVNFQQYMFVHSDKRSISLKLSDELNRPVDLNRADYMFILERLDD